MDSMIQWFRYSMFILDLVAPELGYRCCRVLVQRGVLSPSSTLSGKDPEWHVGAQLPRKRKDTSLDPTLTVVPQYKLVLLSWVEMTLAGQWDHQSQCQLASSTRIKVLKTLMLVFGYMVQNWPSMAVSKLWSTCKYIHIYIYIWYSPATPPVLRANTWSMQGLLNPRPPCGVGWGQVVSNWRNQCVRQQASRMRLAC